MNSEAPKITTRAEFGTAIAWGFEQAIAGGARRIVCVDADFADWPLDDPVLHERLTAWLRLPQRRLALLAASFDEVPRRHPRFVAWRARWAHAVEGFAPPESDAADLPCVLVDDTAVGVQLIDRVHWRGRAERDPRSARLLRDSIDAVLQRSEASFSVNRVGL